MRLQTILCAGLLGATLPCPPSIVGAAESLEPCSPPRSIETRVPYFSKQGKRLARSLGLRSPVRVLGLDKVDPPRSLPADGWRGLFCREWIDATRHCALGPEVTCRDRTGAEQAHYRPPHVECIDDVPFGEAMRVCTQLVTIDSSGLDDGTNVGTQALSGASITFDRTKKRWCYDIAEDMQPSARLTPTQKSANVLYRRRDISCQIPYRGNEDDSVFVEAAPSNAKRPSR